jgi:hypothetical protein
LTSAASKLNNTLDSPYFKKTIYIMDEKLNDYVNLGTLSYSLVIQSGLSYDDEGTRRRVTWTTNTNIAQLILFNKGDLTIQRFMFNYTLVSNAIRPT